MRAEESARSRTDLTEIRKKFAQERGITQGAEPAGDSILRNHGLFSKAERALEIAGWTERARADIEIFKLIASDGLTPLLMVLTEAHAGRHGVRASGKPVEAAKLAAT